MLDFLGPDDRCTGTFCSALFIWQDAPSLEFVVRAHNMRFHGMPLACTQYCDEWVRGGHVAEHAIFRLFGAEAGFPVMR